MGVERKRLGWQRRDDWASHPQLAHQLETNRFVTDLIAATLDTADLGVAVWWSSAGAAGRVNDKLMRRSLVPTAPSCSRLQPVRSSACSNLTAAPKRQHGWRKS
jgi:hypothetical protein